jgi:hypothetical protein
MFFSNDVSSLRLPSYAVSGKQVITRFYEELRLRSFSRIEQRRSGIGQGDRLNQFSFALSSKRGRGDTSFLDGHRSK